MTPNKPKDYTVSECQILKWLELDYSVRDIATEIRSGTRPVSIPPEGAAPEPLCPHFGDIDCCPVAQECRVRVYCSKYYDHIDKLLIEQRKNDAAIAQAAREKMLDKLKEVFDDQVGMGRVGLTTYETTLRRIDETIESLRHPAQDPPTECTWAEDENGNWHTSCGRMYTLSDGTPEENEMKYCAFCGKPLRSKQEQP